MMSTTDQLIMKLKRKMLYWQHGWTFERLRTCVKIREATLPVSILTGEACFPMGKAERLGSVAIVSLHARLLCCR